MAGAVLELQCERPYEALLAVERLPEVKEVALFGRGLHAVATDAAAAERAIRAALARDGVAAARVERITPTIEDVFVSLIEARDRSDGNQAEVRR